LYDDYKKKIPIFIHLMQYQEIQPQGFLSQVVRYFWIISHDAADNTGPVRYQLFAESSPSVVFFPYSDESILAGHTCKSREILIGGRFLMIGACLYPYAVPLLFKISTATIRDTCISLDDLANHESSVTKEKMVLADNHRDRIKILSDYLFYLLKRTKVVQRGMHGCVQSIVSSNGQTPVDLIVDQLGISQRQAERKFNEQVGLSPKLFSRLIRFHSSLKFAAHPKPYSLTEIAYLSGYFDQSHFIREFREFSGISPKNYFNLNSQHRADNFIRLSD
jgi:AraC-like DNA-binding protein